MGWLFLAGLALAALLAVWRAISFTPTSSTTSTSGSVAGGTTLVPLSAPVNLSNTLKYTQGTGNGQCDLCYFASFALTASGGATPSVTLDLTSLPDPFGNAGGVVFARVKMFKLILAAGASAVKVGNAASNAPLLWMDDATAVTEVRGGVSGGQFENSCTDSTGWAIDATHKSLKIANQDAVNAAAGTLEIWGCSA